MAVIIRDPPNRRLENKSAPCQRLAATRKITSPFRRKFTRRFAKSKRCGWREDAASIFRQRAVESFCLGTFALCVGLLTCPGSTLANDESCPRRDPEIIVPEGFCVTIFADHVGHARHLVVGPDNTVYVNTWSGGYYDYDYAKPPEGGFVIALKDRDGDGVADVTTRSGPSATQGGHGGTGIAFYDQKLFVEENDKIVRYKITPDGSVTGRGETVVDGLPLGGAHLVHPFAIDHEGRLFIAPGSATDACEDSNKNPLRGESPCQELTTRAGVWLYDANRAGQHFSPDERYATGCRNAEGLDFDKSGRLYATQHGRGHLHENWPELYNEQQGFKLPAEELMIIRQGASYGWPLCYFDAAQHKRVLAPEYGGDGKKSVLARVRRYPLPSSQRIGHRTI